MAWIESHQELGRHPKTKKLARQLGISIPTAMGHLHLVWHWAMDFAQDGDLSGFEAWEIADAAMWEGDADEFAGALAAVEFIDRTDTGSELHDWHDYAGKLIQRRKEDAERKRQSRQKPDKSGTSVDDPDPSGGCPPDVRTPSDVTVPYPTEPNPTGGSDDPPAPARADADASEAGQQPPPKPRTPKQLESDRKHERRTALFEAYCRGLGIDADGDEAMVYRDRAFRELKPVIDKPAPIPDDLERCTHWMSLQDWRDAPPTVPQVLGSFAGWAAKGKPRAPDDTKPATVARFTNGRRGGYSAQELVDMAKRGERSR